MHRALNQSCMMGGCRCSYKDCLKATSNSDNFHFFHYPIRDRKRCMEWIQNANKLSYIGMPNDQLRNKVVCQLHFEDSCFTNESKRRLIHNAIPTLDGFEILQSGCDANVFSVDTINTTNAGVSSCPTYCIQNGDIVPTNDKCTSRPHLKNDVIFKRNSILNNQTRNIPNNESRKRAMCGSPPQTENNLPDSVKLVSALSGSALLNTVAPARIDIVNMSKIVDHHSRQIAKLNRTFKQHIFTNRIISQFRKKMKLIKQLRGLIPPSLHAIISLHLSPQKTNLTEKEVKFIISLYNNSPSTYKFLIEDCHWKLPSIQIVEELISERNIL